MDISTNTNTTNTDATSYPVVVNPVIAQPPASGLASLITLFFNRKKKKQVNLQHIIETKLETPVFFIVTITMVIRAAQLFSGGTLVMSQVLGTWYTPFQVITGIGLAIGSEMLMTIAGRAWRRCEGEAAELPGRPGISKVARQALINKEVKNGKYSQRVMFVGMGASIYAGISYLFTNSGHVVTFMSLLKDAAFYTDIVVCVVVTTSVFYLGVLKEGRATSDAEEALAEIDASMNEAVLSAIHRFKAGKQTPVDEKLIAEHLPPSKKNKFLRAVAKINKGKVWTSKELRIRLGIGNDATLIRKLNRRVNELARDPENCLEKGPDNKTWMIPYTIVMDEWGDAITAHDAMVLSQRNAVVLAQAS